MLAPARLLLHASYCVHATTCLLCTRTLLHACSCTLVPACMLLRQERHRPHRPTARARPASRRIVWWAPVSAFAPRSILPPSLPAPHSPPPPSHPISPRHTCQSPNSALVTHSPQLLFGQARCVAPGVRRRDGRAARVKEWKRRTRREGPSRAFGGGPGRAFGEEPGRAAGLQCSPSGPDGLAGV